MPRAQIADPDLESGRPFVAVLGRIAACALLLGLLPGQEPRELVIPTRSPVIDGDLSDWPPDAAALKLDQQGQVVDGRSSWSGVSDASAELMVVADTNHLYVAGQVRDDQILAGPNLARLEALDRVELWLGPVSEPSATGPVEAPQLWLMPLHANRPWSWEEGGRSGLRQSGTQLAGVRVVGRRIDATTYQFEAAVPFHHVPTLRPGTERLAFDVLLRDADEGDGGQVSVLAWSGRSPAAGQPAGRMRVAAPGLLVSSYRGEPWLPEELAADLPFLLVPVATIVGLLVLTWTWRRLQRRTRSLRMALVAGGIVLLAIGLFLPGQLADWRAADQRGRLDDALASLETTIGKLEQGTLASYRGASRDRAFVDLLTGKSIARQRYTTYRPLAQLAPDQFGPAPRDFDGLPIRPYWLPLASGRAETFQFDPPLRGTKVHLVVGRPFVPAFAVGVGGSVVPRLHLELDDGGEPRGPDGRGAVARRSLDVQLDGPFADGSPLGRDFWQANVVPVTFDRELRSLTVTAERGADLRLVGVSLEGATLGRVEPISLGVPSLGGVLTDLRGPYPTDAGIELAPGATAKVAVPRLDESPQKLWMFYRAVYPGIPTANPGAKVAEVLLHFDGGKQKRTILLEHQVSMFYELAVHNTRDAPPEGSPAAIASSWIDDSQEKHQNLVYPVLDLPSDAVLDSIEFRNLSGYRIRFRSVVFGNERSAAPQDPVDAPLIRDGHSRRLREDVLARLQGIAVTVYRGGRASETSAPSEQRKDTLVLPRTVQGAQRTAAAEVMRDGSRRATVYAPLAGDGWDGAVLALSSLDSGWASASQWASRLGFVLCLLGAPFVLVLLSELLVASTNLRFRLMAVMTVAALAPLGLLSFLLVQVLESGHAKDLRGSMLANVRSATGQLAEQKDRLKASARQWLRDLAAMVDARIEKAADGEPAKAGGAGAAVAAWPDVTKLLAGQLPPEWGGGFLRVEWQPAGKSGEPLVAVAGDERAANTETPARLEPGVVMQWGILLLGVRAEEASRAGMLTLTAGRPIDANLLGALAPGQMAMLTDVRGYPVAVNGGRTTGERWLASALDPSAMAQRERAVATGSEQREPVVERADSAAGALLCGSDVLRDVQDTPRGLLVLAQPDQRATLDLAIGRVPVRAFFLLIAGCLVVLTAFLSFVVSGRISQPIERLERGALALSRGDLDTRVAEMEGGQIGRLTRTFNQMAALLQARLLDLQALNRTMRELAAETDEGTTIEVLRRFCATHTAADVLRIVFADPAGTGLVAFPGGAPSHADALPMERLAGAFSLVPVPVPGNEPWAALLPECRSATGVPIVFGGRARGAVLLGFTRREPLPVDLELLSTVVAQAAVAFERSRLHRYAVQDPVTGALTFDYFRGRVVDEVSLAQQRGVPLAMVAIALGDGERRPRGLRRFAGVLLDRVPAAAVVCHVGAGQFHVAMPGAGRASAEHLIENVRAAWGELVRQLPENDVEEQVPTGVVVVFPEDAPSAEFLFDALRARLKALATPGASAMESDESLQRAGVTAVSPAMRAVYQALRRVAPTDLPILLEGETGVGKEVLTNLVHRWSRRAGGPLVKVHCAALTETLLASELFGHEKGAFTGAERRKIGRFEQADGGTLFLDEVGDIPLDVQVKLLRVLQEGEVDRVGGTETVKVDVRVVAATNRDIGALVAAGRFREDLYYRLQGMVVKVPPLRERKHEIADLVEHFRREVVSTGQGRARSLSTDAMDEIYRREWPGNVRELRNTVFRAMVLAAGDVVSARDVAAVLDGRTPVGMGAGAGAPDPTPPSVAAMVEQAAPGSSPDRAGSSPPPPAATAASPEPEFVLPRRDPEDAASIDTQVFTLETLPPRLRVLLDLVRSRGACSTQDHMAAAGVSHRTSLRDMQALVRAGLVVRIGSRRGAFYQPSTGGGRFPESAPHGDVGA